MERFSRNLPSLEDRKGFVASMKRIIRAGSFYARKPARVLKALRQHYSDETADQTARPESLLPPSQAPYRRTLQHIAAYSHKNAGDHILPVALRDLFDMVGDRSRWLLRHAHPPLRPADLAKFNSCQGLVIGGGGLFLRDTNPNPNSGWQWNCSIADLRAITAPIVLFAVGYNRFRGQPDFDPVFREHLAVLTEKAVYLGLRNSGSIRAIRGYLPTQLRDKVRYQPCMTTLLSRLYPEWLQRHDRKEKPVLAINTAFDRADLRFGKREVEILSNLARSVAELKKDVTIQLVLHTDDDSQIMPFLRSEEIPFEKVDLRIVRPKAIAQYYANVDIVIGMRGHAQMIPFGCGTPMISLISHDKLRWFLDDIGRPEWGMEIDDPDIVTRLPQMTRDFLARSEEIKRDIHTIQDRLWNISAENVRIAIATFDAHNS